MRTPIERLIKKWHKEVMRLNNIANDANEHRDFSTASAFREKANLLAARTQELEQALNAKD